MKTFYTGTHLPNWLTVSDYPLFVSHRRLAERKSLPVAKTNWALDSGGFSELSMFGKWVTKPTDYVASVKRYMSEIGKLDWAACQDWMCEPFMLSKTGLTVSEHQRRTIDSYLLLNSLAPELPWIPVLQGYRLTDYLRHADMYQRANVDLEKLLTVGVGSVCRRQHTEQAEMIFYWLSTFGLRLHGFGLKIKGLARSQNYLVSADSMAWSFDGRRSAPLPGHTHKNCANCREFATQWRNKVMAQLSIRHPNQMWLMTQDA